MTGLMNLTELSPLNEDSVIPTEEIQRDMDRVKVVAEHVSSIKKMNQLDETDFENLQRNLPFTTAMHSAFPKVELIPENMVDIKTLSEHVGKGLEGKFLLCRTITPAFQMRSIKTIVEDPAGEHAIQLELYNYSTSVPRVTKLENVLPTGSFLAIKNPWFVRMYKNGNLKSSSRSSEDPSQVELLSLKSVTKMFPGVKWLGEFPHLDFVPNENFWSTTGDTERETCGILKSLGNVGFVEKRFTDAIRWYNLALDYANDDEDFRVDIHSNRAAMFLNLRCFHRALEDAERVLQEKPSHVKAVYRKTKALMGLGKYAEAANFISEKMNTYKELAENGSLLEVSDTARNLSSRLSKDIVDIDIMKLVKVSETVSSVEDALQFTGPVKQKSLKDGNGDHGDIRGVVATEDIRPGRLLVSSKALAYARLKSYGSTMNTNKLKGENVNLSTGSGFNLDAIERESFAMCGQIAYKIHFEPEESGPEIYKLYAGPDLAPLPEDSDATRSVDLNRIQRIVQYNWFGTSLARRLESSCEDKPYITFSGLWSLPSFMNHSCCDVNAMWFIVGDMFVVRAIKPIKEGEEVIISIVLPVLPYELRKQSFLFDPCNCRLCELDKADKNNGNLKKRNDLLQILQRCTANESFCVNINELNDTIAKLESLRMNKLETSLAFNIVPGIATLLYQCRQYKKSQELWLKAYEVQKEIGLVLDAISTSLIILQCCLILGDKKGVAKWVNTLKKDLVASYGCIEIVESIDEGGIGILRNLQAVGINFFQE